MGNYFGQSAARVAESREQAAVLVMNHRGQAAVRVADAIAREVVTGDRLPFVLLICNAVACFWPKEDLDP